MRQSNESAKDPAKEAGIPHKDRARLSGGEEMRTESCVAQKLALPPRERPGLRQLDADPGPHAPQDLIPPGLPLQGTGSQESEDGSQKAIH